MIPSPRGPTLILCQPRRLKSPYVLSVSQQVELCVRRGFQRLRGDLALIITGAFFNAIMALVIGSIFYDLPNNTDTLYSRGALLFFAILLASFASALEVRFPSNSEKPPLLITSRL